MTKRNRIISAITALIVVFVLLFSILYIATESNHDCTGEDCPICEQIALCEQQLKQISGGVTFAVVTFFISFTVCTVLKKYVTAQKPFTLITLKVKLSA